MRAPLSKKAVVCQVNEAADSTTPRTAMTRVAICMSAERSEPHALRPALANLLREDGSVVIPASVAAPVLRLLVVGLTDRVRADGGEIGAMARRVLYALHEAAQRADQAPGFGEETPADHPGIVEITAAEMASEMGCSPQYVRRLCASGALRARRAGRTWLITTTRERHGQQEHQGADRG